MLKKRIMSQITVTPGVAPTSPVRLNRYWLALGVLLILAGVWWGYRIWTAQAAPRVAERSVATTISTKTLEERYGIRLRLIAVSAAGGLVDFRYIITDQAKAEALHDYLGKITLTADDNSTTLTMATGHGMHRNDRLENGQLNFHFFANTRNAVRPGRPVTVNIGPVRLEPVNAQ